MSRRVFPRSWAACALPMALLLAAAQPAIADERLAPELLEEETPIRLFGDSVSADQRQDDKVFQPGQAFALPTQPDPTRTAVPVPTVPHDLTSGNRVAPLQHSAMAERGAVLAGAVMPVAHAERSALSDSAGRPVHWSREAHQEELPIPLGSVAPGGEIILDERPGIMTGPCFDCPSCGGPGCVPGRSRCCSVCTSKTQWGRFWCAMYETICCPDPCWDPQYLPVADASFFVPIARPTTHTRFRWDAGFNLRYPDRAEWFWARDDGQGLGPQPVAPYLGEPKVNYDELSMYTEAAIKGFAFTFEMPYRSVDPFTGGVQAGFGDIIMGTKSLVFDRELFQIAFQFRTFIPAGRASEGLGVGHVSLEPSLILGFNLSPVSYFQGQIAQWIPIAADSYAGGILHYHLSYNHTLHYILPDVPLIGTLEANGWSFQDGSYTDPELGTLPANDWTYLNAAVGLRMFMCDWLDMGASASFALGSPNWAEQLYRLECRMRY